MGGSGEGVPQPRPPQPTGQKGQPPGQGLRQAGWMGWEAAPDIKSLAGTMDGEAVPGGMRGSSFMEAATIPSPQERVIKQVNKAVALLKSPRVPGAGRGRGGDAPPVGGGGGAMPSSPRPPSFTGSRPTLCPQAPREGDPPGQPVDFTVRRLWRRWLLQHSLKVRGSKIVCAA